MQSGSKITDDRGHIIFNNNIKLEGVKRFYVVGNHQANFIRAWHGHKIERKYITCISGAAIVCYIPMDYDKFEDQKAIVKRTVLSPNGSMLEIPAGNYNGWMSLTDDTQLLVLSCSTLEESMGDDYRKEVDFFNTDVWKIIQR